MRTYSMVLASAIALATSAVSAQVTQPATSAPVVPADTAADALPAPAPMQPGPAATPQTMPPPSQAPEQIQDARASVPANPFVESKAAAVAPPSVDAHPRPRSIAKPPPAHIDAKAGINTIFGIAQGHLNRIVTPFHSPMVQTTSGAQTSVEKNIVYVATGTPEPVGLFIYDEKDPVSAISVTLVPSDIPPVSVDIGLSDAKPLPKGAAFDRKGNGVAARSWETQQPYVETLTHAFKDVAQGKIPDGYSLESIPAWPASLPRCQPPGLETTARQSLTGFNAQIIVALAKNVSGRRLTPDLSGPGCSDLSVMGVTTWPSTELSPGQRTELYVAYRRKSEDANDTLRPSLIGGGP